MDAGVKSFHKQPIFNAAKGTKRTTREKRWYKDVGLGFKVRQSNCVAAGSNMELNMGRLMFALWALHRLLLRLSTAPTSTRSGAFNLKRDSQCGHTESTDRFKKS